MRFYSLLSAIIFPLTILGQDTAPILDSDTLRIRQLTANTYVHISYLPTDSYGKVVCNGLIYVDGGQALVLDSPTSTEATQMLLRTIEQQIRAKVIGVVANHYHEDCTAGLTVFHEKGIPSYALNETLVLAKDKGKPVPQHGFDENLTLKVGNKEVRNRFFGAAHSRDNICSYLPSEKVLFGGCPVKSLGAGKGYLGDADTEQWPKTLTLVKQAYPDIEVVVPGHGKSGGVELLDFTIQLFKN
ncbi:subclass B1 metallo-beta-lactamase [Sediminicola luteus]|uniref:beta-lactamase n=1 Tax=Sediminicola luteus TaxID=319238 RepID=A0A2A4G9R9_9FLAO|nr:subclass B1 metallo-beta-lactamase [Sediminicola luteus]PCE64718.1 hypothetical protein B7P33_05975 [Sediminicola luteus]